MASSPSLPGPCLLCGQDCMHRLELMTGLPLAQQTLLMRRAVQISLDRNETLFETGDPVCGIFLIRRGRIKLTNFDAEGREQIVGIFSAGDTLWEDLSREARYPYTGVCLEPADVCRLDRTVFEEALQDPQIALRVIDLLSRRLRDANARNLLLSTPDPLQRLAGFLLRQSRDSQGDTVTLRLEDIAGSISLRSETVSRKLRELEKQGLVKRIGQSGIRILDREGLQTVFVRE